MPTVPPSPSKSLFVSSVEGELVSRYGSGRPSSGLLPHLIGATRGKDGVVTWQTDQVVEIPEPEANRYQREYARAIKSGALKLRTAEDAKADTEKAPTEPPGAINLDTPISERDTVPLGIEHLGDLGDPVSDPDL